MTLVDVITGSIRQAARAPRTLRLALAAALCAGLACAAQPPEPPSRPPAASMAQPPATAAASTQRAAEPAPPQAAVAAPLPATPGASPRAGPPTLLVDAVLNGGFELVADSTSHPPKYGAYWVGAFAPTAEESWCHVAGGSDAASDDAGGPADGEDAGGEAARAGAGSAGAGSAAGTRSAAAGSAGAAAAFRGERFLRLTPAAGEVSQKLVADVRWSDEVEVSLALRPREGSALRVALRDGPGRVAALVVSVAGGRLTVADEDGAAVAPTRKTTADGWHRVSLPLGEHFVSRHGSAPQPRLELRLSVAGAVGAAGLASAAVDVDEVSAAVRWPAIEAAELSTWIADTVRWTLRTWYSPRGDAGLGLVDPATGYASVTRFHVETGEALGTERFLGFHTIHTLLVRWLEECERRGWHDEAARWQPALTAIVRTLLDRHFDERTGLPRTIDAESGRPTAQATTVAVWVDFLLDAREVLDDAELSERCLAQARRIADTLIALQAEHDIPPERAPKRPVWNDVQGRLVGDTSNWFGHIPDRLTPAGEIETDRRFYTSWAILTGRSFWYELMRSPRAILRVHALRPGPRDVPAAARAISLFHRDWDAARYDLENDTDDHYGYLCEDLLGALHEVMEAEARAEGAAGEGGATPDSPGPGRDRAAAARAPAMDAALERALALVQSATDHRLERTVPEAGDTLWIQALRLGTACAGDSPRAFLGPLELYELPPEVNPTSSGLPLYRDALLELARNDLQGRQLTNGQFTESFFKSWEMVCICYRGTYQGDCRDHPEDFWHGDVGDTFGGPPTAAIDAQAAAYRVAHAGERPAILAALALVRDVTEATLLRRHGYLFGLDEAIARQYELPAKYTIGLSDTSAAGLGYVMAWLRLLPYLPDEPAPAPPRIEFGTHRSIIGGVLDVHAPPGSRVALLVSRRPFPTAVSAHDRRMLALDLADVPGGLEGARIVSVSGTGRSMVQRFGPTGIAISEGVIQAVTLDQAGAILAIGNALRFRP